MTRTPQGNERLQLSRRRFFFFGSILAAKPEIVVPKSAVWPGAGFENADNLRHALWLPPEVTLAMYYLPTPRQLELIRSGRTVRVARGQYRVPFSRRPA